MEFKKEVILGKVIAYPTHHEVDIAMETLYQKISGFKMPGFNFFPEFDCIISDNEMFEEITERLGIGFKILRPSNNGITELCKVCRKFSFVSPLVLWVDNSTGSTEKFKEMVNDRWSFYAGTLFRNTKYPATEDVFGEEYEGDLIVLPSK